MVEENKPAEGHALLNENKDKSTRFIVQEIPKDVEGALVNKDSTGFNPFIDRKIDSPTTDCQTLTHLLKSTLGSGIMTMPFAFQNAGIIVGILGGFIIAAVTTHTSYVLVDCAHILYYRTKKKKMDYPDVLEAAFATGPKWTQNISKIARYTVQVGIFATYFGACSADNILIATNFGQVIKYYTTNDINGTIAATVALESLDNSFMRSIIACLMLPLILLVWVPDLKYLAPISTIANFCMAIVLGLTFYHVVPDPKPISELALSQPITKFPYFFATALFAMANIGVIMPLENNMKTPRHLIGPCGILNRGMFGITFVYLLLGVFGYMKYGDSVQEIITANLPVENSTGIIVKILIGSTVLLSFGLQFYVCREMAWDSMKHRFQKHPLVAEYIVRTLLVVICVSIAIAIPKIGPLINLVGALGFSLLGIVCPVIIETVTYWEIGYGRFNWRIYKNIFFIVFGLTGLFSGSYLAIQDIIKVLTQYFLSFIF